MMKNSKFAVSLKYPENVCAQVITAKSSGIVAQRMIELAEENGIPVVEDDVLANVLSIKQVGECIPESTWEAVASIFAFIKLMEERVK